MAHNYEHEAMEGFHLPEQPDKENFTLRVSYEATLKAYWHNCTLALAKCKQWKQHECVKDACCEDEATKVKAVADKVCRGTMEWVMKHPCIKEGGEDGPSVECCKCCVQKGKYGSLTLSLC